MGPPTSLDPPGFVRIGNDIWIVEANKPESPPTTDVGALDTASPTLILLFGWMDAKIANVAKFSAGYRKLFPSASQLVVGSSSWACFFLRATPAMHEMQPALDYLISQGVLGDDARPHRILTQSMSNGGCIRLDHLSKLIASKSLKSHPSTRSLMVIDSAPGGDTLECALNAFETLSWILGRTPRLPFEAIRQGILDRNWLPWTALENTDGSKRKTLWLFIYSRVDQLVLFDHVQKFTEAAESHGMDIRREIYEDTPHVAHMRGDPERYWGAIKSCWDGVVKTEVLA